MSNAETPLGVYFFNDKEDIDSAVDITALVAGMTPQQVIVRLAIDLNFAAKFFLPDVCTYDFPPLIVGTWNETVKSLGSLQKRRGIMRMGWGIPRGFTKTLLAKLMMVYAVIYTRHTFILTVGSVVDNGANIIKDVITILSQPHVRAYFGDWDADIESNNSDLRHFRWLGKEIILKPKGACTSVRGLNLGNRRPDFILMDDVISEQQAMSPIEAANIYAWIVNTLLPAASPKGMIALYLGNMYNSPGCILSKIKKSPNWVTLTLGAILADGTSLWEELHPIRKLLDEFNAACDSGQEAAWLAQYMNGTQSDVSKELNLVQVEAMFQAKFGMGEIDYEGKFIIVDPAGFKERADETAVLVAGIHGGLGIALEVESKIRNPLDTIKTAVRLALKHGIRYVFVESIAYQATLIFWANYILKQFDLTGLLTFVEITPERVNKTARIRSSFSLLESGALYVHPDMWMPYKLEAKVFNVLKSNNDDNILDAVQYIPQVIASHGTFIIDDYSEYKVRATFKKFEATRLPVNYRSPM